MEVNIHSAVVIKTDDSYVIRTAPIEERPNLEAVILKEGCQILLWVDAPSRLEAREEAKNLHLKTAKTNDEKMGLFYHYADPEALLKNIEQFRKLDARVTSDEIIMGSLKAILLNHRFVRLTFTGGIQLHRARYIKPNQSLFKTKGDIWYHPFELINEDGSISRPKVNRLNKEGEPMLYTTMNTAALIEEARLKVNDSFAHIIYTLKPNCSLHLSLTGVDEDAFQDFSFDGYDKTSWSKEAKVYYGILNAFLVHEFTRDVGVGTEFIYKNTQLFASKLYNSPGTQGYIYRSVAHKEGYNVAIKPEAADSVLAIGGLIYCTFLGADEEGSRVFFHPYMGTMVGDTIRYSKGLISQEGYL